MHKLSADLGTALIAKGVQEEAAGRVADGVIGF